MVANLKTTPAQERAFAQFLEERGSQPFRRQDVATALYKVARPRLMGNARELADVLLARMRSENRLIKAGHVHWRQVTRSARPLKSGRMVPELADVTTLSVHTRCPAKYALIDLETGDVWHSEAGNWARATAATRTEAAAVLDAAGK